MELNRFTVEVLPIRGKIYNYSIKMLGNAEEAEDTVQEVFLKLWEMRAKLSEYDNIEALTVTMTKNLCLNKLSFRQRHVKEELQEIRNDETAERKLENADAVDWVRQIIETLPPLQKMIIKMRDIEDYDMETIAEITGSTEEAVRMNLSRARKKVKEVFFKINKIS